MARSYSRSEHSMQGAFIFVLLGLFALMSTLMVLLGAQMYRATVDHSQNNNQDRLLSAYVRSMVRAQDGNEAISIEEVDGASVLCMTDEWMGDMLVTRLYQHEGKLYEDFIIDRGDEDDPFELGDGEAICDANSFVAEMNGNLLTVNMTDANDQPCEVRVALHCAN